MRLVLSLAGKGRAGVQPNPMVGALIVNDGEIVGEGFHERVGEEHAEVRAIKAAGQRAKGGTLYVNLEPCDHFGRTPPCTQTIIAAGITRVICADRDPNLIVNGRGIAALEGQGIAVEEGILREESRKLNEIYYIFTTTQKPFVSLKLAQSLDGKIVYSRVTKWITGLPARRRVHEMRACHASIMVGIGTVETDDPMLTVRYGDYASSARQPLRVIIDADLQISIGSGVVRTAGEVPTLAYTGEVVSEEKVAKLVRCGVHVQHVPRGREGKLDLEWILADLGTRDVSSVLLEGGREIASSFLAQGLVHKVHLFMAPCILGEREGTKGFAVLTGQGLPLCRLRDVTLEMLGNDILVCGYPETRGE